MDHLAGEVVKQLRTVDHVCPAMLLVYAPDDPTEHSLKLQPGLGMRVESRVEGGVRVYTVSHVTRQNWRGATASGRAAVMQRMCIGFSMETRDAKAVVAHLKGCNRGQIVVVRALGVEEEVTEDVLSTPIAVHHHVLAQFRISEAGAPEAALNMLSYRPAKPTARTTHEVNAYTRTQLRGACNVLVETIEHPV